MYHIKQDQRAEASVELICGAVLRLLEEKPFERITVTDVQRTSTVSRSTFYHNFDRLEDVLELLCDRGFAGLFAQQRLHPERESLPVAVFRYWFDHSTVLEALVQIHRADILFSSFRRCAAGLDELRQLVEDEAQYDYFVTLITSGMMGVLITWIEHGKTETREQVLSHMAAAFGAFVTVGLL